jgi:hypothetical protein
LVLPASNLVSVMVVVPKPQGELLRALGVVVRKTPQCFEQLALGLEIIMILDRERVANVAARPDRQPDRLLPAER